MRLPAWISISHWSVCLNDASRKASRSGMLCVFWAVKSGGNMRAKLRVLVLLTLLSFVATCAFGQAESGQITGTVRDASGAVVRGASVTVSNLATGATRPVQQTGRLGQYNVVGLASGIYEVTVKSSGFALYRSRVEVTVGSHVSLDTVLAVNRETITVGVVAAGGTEINTATPEISQLITPIEMAQLPSLNRNPYDFVALAGNVSNADRTSREETRTARITASASALTANGRRARKSCWTARKTSTGSMPPMLSRCPSRRYGNSASSPAASMRSMDARQAGLSASPRSRAPMTFTAPAGRSTGFRL